MIKVESFEYADELQKIIDDKQITREDIIDIKWACTSHYTYGILIYEDDNI